MGQGESHDGRRAGASEGGLALEDASSTSCTRTSSPMLRCKRDFIGVFLCQLLRSAFVKSDSPSDNPFEWLTCCCHGTRRCDILEAIQSHGPE